MKKIFLIVFISVLFDLLLADSLSEFNFAKKMYDDTLYEEAVIKFQEIIKKYPTSNEADKSQLYLGNCFMQVQEYNKAIAAYKHLLDAYPNSEFIQNAIYYLAEAQYHIGDYSSASKNFSFLINNYPQNSFSLKSLKKLVKSYFKAEDYNKAILAAENILRNYSSHKEIPAIILILAEVYKKNDMVDDYKSALEKIIVDYPESESRWIAAKRLTQFYINKKQYGKAAEIVKENMSDYTPRDYEKDYLLYQADILVKSEKQDSAIKIYEEYFRKFDTAENLDVILYKIAKIYYNLEHYNKSRQKCNDFMQKFPESSLIPKVHFLLAKIYFQNMEYKKALEELEPYIYKDSNKKLKFQAEHLQAHILESQELYKSAISQYINILQNYVDFISGDSIYFHIADIYQNNLQNYVKAMDYYKIIQNTYPRSALLQKTYLNLADCYQRLGRYNEALSVLNSAINLGGFALESEGRVLAKINYIKDFKIKNEDKALENFMNCFVEYINSKDAMKALIAVIKIYKDELKKYQQALQIFDNYKELEYDAEALLLKGKLFLDLAKKCSYENCPDVDKYYSNSQNAFETLVNRFQNVPEKAYAEYYLISLNLRSLPYMSKQYIEQLKKSSLDFVNKYTTFPEIGNVYLNLAKAYKHAGESKKQIIVYLQQAITLSNKSSVKNKALQLLGDIYFEKKSYVAALKRYKDIDKEYIIKNAELLFKIGVAEFNISEYKNCIEYLKKFISKFPQNKNYWEAIEYIADSYLQQNEYDMAIIFYKRLVSNKPEDAVYRKLINLYIIQMKFNEAIAASKEIENPNNQDMRTLAELYREANMKNLAILEYQKIVKADTVLKSKLPDLVELANINFEIENYNAAINNFLEIIDLTSESKDRILEYDNLPWEKIAENLITSYYRIKKRTKAEEYYNLFEDIIERYPNIEAKILLERGIYLTYYNQKEANNTFKNLVKQYGNSDYSDDAYFQQGLLALKSQELELAKQKLKELIANYPQSELVNNAYLKLGSINFTQENYKEALENYQYVITNDKEGKLAMQAIENFALTCKTMNEWMVAIEAYQLLLERFGSKDISAKTLFQIAYCYYMDKKYKKAIEIFNQIISKVPDRELKTEILYWVGESYYGLGKYEKAIETLLKIVYEYNNYDQWYVNASIKIAMAYEKQQKWDKAKLFYNNIIENYGIDSKWGKEAKKLLDELP